MSTRTRRRAPWIGVAALAAVALVVSASRRAPPRATAARDDGAAAQAPRAPPPVAAPAAPPPTGLPIRLAPAPPASRAERAEREAASFSGRVVASSDGRGIGGAELTFSRGGAAASARADAAGRFRFEPPAPGRWLLAAVTATGFLPFAPEWGHSPVQLEAVPGRRVDGIEIHLSPSILLRGRVVDPEGAPAAGADVRLLGAAAEAALVTIPSRFTADGDGRFTFSAPAGAVLEARKAGFRPALAEVDPLALASGEVTLQLGEPRDPPPITGPISGRVVAHGGAPIVGALVTAARERRGGGGAMAVPSAQAVTDGEGRFTLRDLQGHAFRVAARAEGRAPASAPGVAPGTSDVVLELPPGSRLRGCVTEAATSRPVTAFTVTLFERRSRLLLVLRGARSVVDPGGCYLLDDVAPGPAAVVVSAPGHAASPAIDVDVPADGAEAVADARLEGGGTLTGSVRDEATGAPLAGARLSVEGTLPGAASTSPVLSEAISGADGGFALSGLPGRSSVHVAAPGHHARILGGVEVAPGGAAGPIDVRLRPVAAGEEPRVDVGGAGMQVFTRGDDLVVGRVVPGSGAAAAGLARLDVILAVDGRPVGDLGMTGALDAIRGQEGTSVVLTIRRGDATLELRVERGLVRG